MTSQSSGGGTSYPGVTANGTNGLIVAGTIEQDPAADVSGALNTIRDNTGGLAFQVNGQGDGNGVDAAVGDTFQIAQFMVNTSSNSSLLYAFAIANAFGRVLNLMSDGTIKTVASLALWGHAAPASQPTLATGASHTVDDVIELLQSYGFCKQS